MLPGAARRFLTCLKVDRSRTEHPCRPAYHSVQASTAAGCRGRRLGRPSVTSFEAGLDEANHSVHEFEQFGGARGSRQGLGFITFVELTQTGDGRQRCYARDQAVSGLAEVFANGLGEGALE